MRLLTLEISRVRNLSSVAIDCSPGLNVFIGPNGAGKTAIIEAVYLLARGRSFRSNTVESVIQSATEALMVRAQLDDELRGQVTVALAKHRNGKTELHVNGVNERRLSEIARLAPVQIILPDSSDLVFGGPQHRRRFLDWGTFHVEPAYLEKLRAYRRALHQRNALLKSARGKLSGASGPALETWTDQVARLAKDVHHARKDYLARLVPATLEKLGVLANGISLAASYRPGWPEAEALEDCLREGVARDVKFGLTHHGPHRADLRLSVEGAAAAAVLSRGQAKLVACALRLAQAELTSAMGGRRSLFLIDDVGAELDAAHNERFFRLLEATGSQVLATATSVASLGSAFAGRGIRLFHVEQGACHPIGT